MQDFVEAHRALIFRHARAHVRTHGEKIPAEDVAREIEIELAQLASKGITAATIESPSTYLGSLVKHAVGRAKRRHTLIEQLAAGDDLEALSNDLSALDADLPPPPPPASPRANEARTAIEKVKDALSPQDALVFSLLFEDEQSIEEVAEMIGVSVAQVASSRERILEVASQQDVPIDPEPRGERGATVSLEAEGRERALRRLARTAAGGISDANHVDEPILALLRHGDHGDDIADAIGHVARCADCRARLALGDMSGRNVVVMAIEAPATSQSHLTRAAEMSSARLVERGQGRWTAVVDADNAERLKGELVSGDTSVVSRLVMTPPLRVAREEIVQGRKTMTSVHDVVPDQPGTNAAEVEAWAKIPRAPRKNVPGGGPGWALFAVFAVLGAVVIAYMLAIR